MRLKKSDARRRLSIIFILNLIASSFVSSEASPNERIKPEEVLANHLNSIGAPETRASIISRIIVGETMAKFRSPTIGQIGGRAVMASEGRKVLIGMVFENPDNPHEKLAFNGKKVTAGYVRPGTYSNLADFLLTHEIIFKQGLMGGTLSSAWPLLDAVKNNQRLEYAGIEKLSDKKAHRLRYLLKGGSDLEITLFFDIQTFQHLRTVYERVINSEMGRTPELSARERQTRYKMVEDFSDFKLEGGLTLPHTYQIELTLDTRRGVFIAEWVLRLSQFSFNQPIDPDSFNVSSNIGS